MTPITGTDGPGRRAVMELRQLEYLVAIAEEGGFGRAAQRLHVVQSAVSQQVARLERELGVALFHRGGRAARPTPAGEQLLPKARAALAAVAVVTETAAALAAGSGGTLRLGSSRAFTGRVHRALDRLADQAPQVRVEVRQETRRARLEGVRSAALDAALIRGEEPSPGWSSRRSGTIRCWSPSPPPIRWRSWNAWAPPTWPACRCGSRPASTTRRSTISCSARCVGPAPNRPPGRRSPRCKGR